MEIAGLFGLRPGRQGASKAVIPATRCSKSTAWVAAWPSNSAWRHNQTALSNHSCLSFVSIWTCLFFFEQRARALQLIEHTGNKHQPQTTMHHSFIAVSHVDLFLTSIKKSVMEGTFAQSFVIVSVVGFFFCWVWATPSFVGAPYPLPFF